MTDTDFHPTTTDNHPGTLVNLTHAEKRWWLLHQVYSPPAQSASEDSTPITVARRKIGNGGNLDLSSISVDTSSFTSLPGIASTVKIAPTSGNNIDTVLALPDIKSIFSEVRENLPAAVAQNIDLATTMPELKTAYADIKESLPATVQQKIDAVAASPDVPTVYAQVRDVLPAVVQQKLDPIAASPNAKTAYTQVRDALPATVQQMLDPVVAAPDVKTAYAQVRDALPATVQQKLDPIVASPDVKTAYAQVRDALPAVVQQKLDPVVASPDVKTAYAQVRDALPATVQQKLDPIVATPDVKTAYAQVRDALPAVVQQKLDPIVASPDVKTAYAQVRDTLPAVVQQKLDPVVASPDVKTAYAQVRDALPAVVQQKLDPIVATPDVTTAYAQVRDALPAVVQQKLDPVIASPDVKTAYAQVRDVLPAAVQQKLDPIVATPDVKTAYAQVRDTLPATVQQKLDPIVATPDVKTAYAQVRDALPATVQQKLDPVVATPDVKTAYAQVRDALPSVVQQKLDPIVATPDVKTAYAQVRDTLPAGVQQKLDPIVSSPDVQTAYAKVRDALPAVVQQKLDPIIASPDLKTAYAQVRDSLPSTVQQKLDPVIASSDLKTTYAQVRDSLPPTVQQKLDSAFSSVELKTSVVQTRDSLLPAVSQKIELAPRLSDSVIINTQPISVDFLSKVSGAQVSDAVKSPKITEFRAELLTENTNVAFTASSSAVTRIGSDNYFSKLVPAFDKTSLVTDRTIVGFTAAKISLAINSANSAELMITNRNLYEVAGKQSISQPSLIGLTFANITPPRSAVELSTSVTSIIAEHTTVGTAVIGTAAIATTTPAITSSPAIIASTSPIALVGNAALDTRVPVSPLTAIVVPVEPSRTTAAASQENDTRAIKTPIASPTSLPTSPITPVTFAPVGTDGQKILIRLEPVDVRGLRTAVIVAATGQRISIAGPVTIGARCGGAQAQTSGTDKINFSTRRILSARSDRYLTGIEFAIFIAAAGIAKTRKGEIDDAAGKLRGSIARRLGQTPQAATEKANEEITTTEVTTQTKSEPKVCTRPIWFVSPGDTLQSIALRSTGDVRFGWLIADINRATIDETSIDGKRVVELRTMQKLELPVWQDLVDFKATAQFDGNVDNLITLVSERHIDREAVSASLERAMGLRPTTTPVAAPAAKPIANPVANPISKPATKPAWLPEVWIAPRPAVSIAAAISLVLPFQAVLNSQDPANLEASALNIGTIEAKHD